MRRLMFPFAVVVVLLAAAYAFATWPFEKTSISAASWHSGGSPLAVQVSVVDSRNRPVRGARVATLNFSDGNAGTTDAAGSCHLETAEREFLGLTVNDVRVIHRDRWYRSGPNLESQGLQVRVQLLDGHAFALPSE